MVGDGRVSGTRILGNIEVVVVIILLGFLGQWKVNCYLNLRPCFEIKLLADEFWGETHRGNNK